MRKENLKIKFYASLIFACSCLPLLFILLYMKAIFALKSNTFPVFPSVIIIHTVSDTEQEL